MFVSTALDFSVRMPTQTYTLSCNISYIHHVNGEKGLVNFKPELWGKLAKHVAILCSTGLKRCIMKSLNSKTDKRQFQRF